jgi:predicted secreted protein
MFSYSRSKKIAIVAHCLLNQNSISDGTADQPSQFSEVIDSLMTHHIGIVQLPCPELLCLGLNRGDDHGSDRELLEENTRIRTLIETTEKLLMLKSQALDLIEQIRDYQRHNFRVVALIGINRSPSCGIETTTRDGSELPGRGVFMQVISDELNCQGIDLPMIGVKTSQKVDSLKRLKEILVRDSD